MVEDGGQSRLLPWHVRAQSAGPDLKLFRVRYDAVENPRTGQSLRAVVLETPDWVNIVAVTERGRIVLVRQFRFGTRELSLEIPGGMVDAGENPLEAARRELREETGFTAEEWLPLGAVEPNPAFHTNRCHTFLARRAVATHAVAPDPGEDLEVVVLDADEVVAQVKEGAIRNSLVVAALGRVLDLRVAPP